MKKVECIERYSARLLDELARWLDQGMIMWGEYFSASVCANARSWNCTMHDLADDNRFPVRTVMFETWSTTESVRHAQGLVPEFDLRCCSTTQATKDAFASLQDQVRVNELHNPACRCAGKWVHGFKYVTDQAYHTAQPQWFSIDDKLWQ